MSTLRMRKPDISDQLWNDLRDTLRRTTKASDDKIEEVMLELQKVTDDAVIKLKRLANVVADCPRCNTGIVRGTEHRPYGTGKYVCEVVECEK